ncbi:hypothetical protein OHV05_26930 [Kitasatospora sp. NBC_00070]|uniref:hypothetical protein n=1 Tax=Kitasatospora sp. NBC_00070 TaxID=2975962 RepID=UPI0032565330
MIMSARTRSFRVLACAVPCLSLPLLLAVPAAAEDGPAGAFVEVERGRAAFDGKAKIMFSYRCGPEETPFTGLGTVTVQQAPDGRRFRASGGSSFEATCDDTDRRRTITVTSEGQDFTAGQAVVEVRVPGSATDNDIPGTGKGAAADTPFGKTADRQKLRLNLTGN